MQNMSSESCNFVFQSKHYMPKEITQQSFFLKKYPHYDGRNTVIAIIDSGIDVSVPGLQKTSTGLPKIIECLDLTGAGDIDTSVVKYANQNGILIGLTERKLKIPKSWKNPSGQWHLGIKAIYEFYSYEVKERINENKNKELQKFVCSKTVKVMKEMTEHERKHKFSTQRIRDFDDREEIRFKLEQLKAAESLSIESPVADCIVWFDGEKWKGCIDTSCSGNLEDAKVLSNFCENQEYGNLLEICVPNGFHGTHVANIAAGHFPDVPEKGGLAPGAQIISLCVGDTRKGGTTLTDQALLRALKKCIEMKVDVINFSYGAHENALDSGNIAKLAKIAVEKYGIIFVAAVGNDGPCLSTAGFCPGKIHHSIISVGAYLTAEMKETMFSHFQDDESAVVFPFSSRGPCLDGTLGVCISAPGAAITGVPKSCLEKMQRQSGTSMSSPNAAGNIACLISALKDASIPISPFRIKFALINSAKMPRGDDPFSLGYGRLQVDSAFEYLQSFSNFIPSNIIDIEIEVNEKRGIYLREHWQTRSPQEFEIKIKTKFLDDSEKLIEERLNFECPIILKLSKGGDKFVKNPKFCCLPSADFKIHVDPTNLEAGIVHYAEITGINPSNPTMGPLFRIPITVIIPEIVDPQNSLKKKFKLEPAISQRLFIKAPAGSSYAAMTIKSCEQQKIIKLSAECAYIGDDGCTKSYGTAFFQPNEKKLFDFWTPEGKTIEFCITQFWDNLNSSNIKVKIDFYGFSVDDTSLHSVNPISKICFKNYLKRTQISPSLEFTDIYQPLNAAESAVIEPMKEKRDFIDGQTSFRLLLTYNFNVITSGSYAFFPEGKKHYHKFIDCCLIQISTISKKHLLTCSFSKFVYLGIGNYIIRLQIRHSNPAFLERLQNIPILVQRTLPNKITVSLYSSANAAMMNEGATVIPKFYEPEETGFVYAAAIPNSLIPSCSPGSFLLGKFSLQPSTAKLHSSFSFAFFILHTSKNNAKDSKMYFQSFQEKDGGNEIINSLDPITKNMKIAIRNIEISYINAYDDDQKSRALFDKLLFEFPKHLPILSEAIERLTKAKNIPVLNEFVAKLLEVAEVDDVLKFYGTQSGFNEDIICSGNLMLNRIVAIRKALFLQANLILDEYLRQTEKDIPNAFRFGFDPKIENPFTSSEEKELEISKENICNKKIAEKANNIDVMKFSTSEKMINATNQDQRKTGAIPETFSAHPFFPALTESIKTDSDFISEQLPQTFYGTILITLDEVEEVYRKYLRFGVTASENTRILKAKYAVIHERFATALTQLKHILFDKTTTSEYLSTEKAYIQLLEKLGWNLLAENQKNSLLIKHQKSFRLL